MRVCAVKFTHQIHFEIGSFLQRKMVNDVEKEKKGEGDYLCFSMEC